MQHAITQLFARYESLVNDALDDHADMAAIRDLYADAFIAAAPAGVSTGAKDGCRDGPTLEQSMAEGFAHYCAIGTKSMTVQNLRITPIDDLHALAHVDWRASYDVRGAHKDVDFTNAYLVRITDGQAQVFGWITGDEDAELRRHGIID
ncbi:DUF4440 domain-containing protein [Altererythrobacter xixiisoli]|uniref:DUF4440 domain-containing protein n=1 Tax=Croceibacterium xixiisoli TaxID=1476466 RepID=A0A6I4TTW6_9SPHN|nr:DUF4440 domain-containing protein [Croceibacterium xixiisoli]MXO99456.1 DUF4440 domain-containing protein [Croceibacterium xixiisoli]